MSRRSIQPQSRRHIWVYDKDWEFINTFLVRPGLPPGAWVREAVHKFVGHLRENQHDRVESSAPSGPRPPSTPTESDS